LHYEFRRTFVHNVKWGYAEARFVQKITKVQIVKRCFVTHPPSLTTEAIVVIWAVSIKLLLDS